MAAYQLVQHLPTITPFKDIRSHYERREEKGMAPSALSWSSILVVIWALFSVATVFVALRLTARWRHNKRLLFDDCWMILAWLCFLTQLILQMLVLEAFFDLDAHPGPAASSSQRDIDSITPIRSQDNPDEAVSRLLRWQFSVIVLFWTCLWSVKAAFLAAFYNLAYPVRGVRYAWYVVALFTLLAYASCWIFVLNICATPADLFRPRVCTTPDNERKQRAEAVFSTTLDAVSDLMIMAIPLAVLPKLLLTRAMKLGIGAAFCLGLLVVTAAILRATQVKQGKVDTIGLAIWGAVETSTAMIVGSLLPIGGSLASHIRGLRSQSLGRRQIGEEETGSTRPKTSGQVSAAHDENTGRMIGLEVFNTESGENSHGMRGGSGNSTDSDNSPRDGDETAILSHTGGQGNVS